MKRTLVLFLAVALLLVTAHRLPAPIQEVPESPTPAPEQSAKPKAKRTVKPKASESSESSTNKRATSPTPSPLRNPFDGTWSGTINNAPFVGTAEDTFVISASGTSVIDKLGKLSPKLFQTTYDGSTIKWTNSTCIDTLTPNPDGKTALVTINCTGVFGIGAYNTSTVFRKVSP
jgi:cytoskeletal protein RodZ